MKGEEGRGRRRRTGGISRKRTQCLSKKQFTKHQNATIEDADTVIGVHGETDLQRRRQFALPSKALPPQLLELPQRRKWLIHRRRAGPIRIAIRRWLPPGTRAPNASLYSKAVWFFINRSNCLQTCSSQLSSEAVNSTHEQTVKIAS